MFEIDSWKAPIRTKLQQAVGLVSGAIFLLMVSVVTHSLSKQKLFAVISKLCALGTGIAGGYLSMSSTREYVKGIPDYISLAASGDYFAEKEEMQIGYSLAKYGAVITLIGCGLIVADIALYMPFGKGKWIWKIKTDVIPDTMEH
ncbi:Hypothetical predicted protein [Mytilus galloprovincialis]|uniref:Uncharacterized protein n=1 Tax=Mytilus galloprovincialis TaxID=29158 RepID=A0A8B6C906_MYTGA|nr:Hypothetical predicted protein [Mytilus galloprovincialis]